jgi:hypothetical protein
MKFFRSLRDNFLSRRWYFQYKEGRHKGAIRRILNLTPEEKAARGITRTVRIAANFPGMWARTLDLTPRRHCQWGETLFVADGPGDLYLVINSILQRQPGNRFLPTVTLPEKERAWALHMEPEEYVKKLGYDDESEATNYSRFYTSCPSLLAEGGIYRPAPPYINFLLSKTWDQLAAAARPQQKFQLGIIMSGLQDLKGHHARFTFLKALHASDIDYVFWGRGENLDRFRGYRGFAGSKWTAHAACRYSIVLENSVAPYYWSEKPADSLLAWSLPFYHGCPNLGDYLPPESFIPIDINQPEAAVAMIRQTLREDSYEQRFAAITEARRRLLHEHHLYAFLDREATAYLSQRNG